LLGDLGADVLTVEHPQGSPIRTMLPKKGQHSMWWKVVQRGKKNISLDLSKPKGREIFLRLARDFDLMVENFRPGTLERWGLGPKDLEAAGLNLVLLRISGFGQSGPRRDQPGFGTVAEAMSGFATLNGFPDGPPVFPSTTLADGVSATFGAFGMLAALVGRLRGGTRGVEVVDQALFEGLYRLIPTQVAGYDQLGKVPIRPGNFLSSHGVLRNLYRSKDGFYFCVSAVGSAAIRRILVAAEAEDLIQRVDGGVMNAPQEEVEAFLVDCNTHLTAWSGKAQIAELMRRLQEADAVHMRIYDVSDIVKDPHYLAREDVLEVPDDELGTIRMQGVVPKFPGRKHTVRHGGKARGADNEAIYGGLLKMSEEELRKLREEGII
jgi:crotonobetainyl-CoA:carnitine CoA-transferase CaiB-like acyl-CoA transferase